MKVIVLKSFVVDFYDSFDSGGDAITSPSLEKREKRENLPLNQLLPCTYYITQIYRPLHGSRTIKGAVPITFESKKFISKKSRKKNFKKIKKIEKKRFFKSKKNEYFYNDHVRIDGSRVRRAQFQLGPGTVRGLPWLLYATN